MNYKNHHYKLNNLYILPGVVGAVVCMLGSRFGVMIVLLGLALGPVLLDPKNKNIEIRIK